MKIIKFIKFKKIPIIIGAIIIAFLFGFSTTYSGKMMMVSAVKRDLPIFCVDKNYKVCSISFDLVNGEQDIDAVINILGKYDIKATFFVSGEYVDKNPQDIVKLSEANQEIMNHSNTNPHMTQLNINEIKHEIELCNSKIEEIAGVKPILFRPPYGEYDDKVIKTLRSMGMMTALWDCDSLDNQNLSADKVSRRITKNIKPGSIVLFHSASKKTSEALEGALKNLIKEDYEFSPVSQLIYQDDYVIDNSGKQIPVCE